AAPVQCSASARYLHSFPTRRSSDLVAERLIEVSVDFGGTRSARSTRRGFNISDHGHDFQTEPAKTGATGLKGGQFSVSAPCQSRSEEHTSELQSRENLVCRLLLEKK